MERYYIFFSCSLGFGPKTFLRLLEKFETAENIYKAPKEKLISAGFKGKSLEKFLESKAEFDFKKYLEKMRMAKVEFIPYGDKYYPSGLKKIDSPPIGLFIKGNRKLLLSKNNICVVGARRITSYGRQVTETLVADLVRNNIVITSGMAMGVDGVAHETAIKNKGLTIAVLGCGVDCPYPKENEKLYEKILDSNGLIVSEYPLGMRANVGTFPARNRIIAALSDGVLITEAAEGSGSLITAEWGLKLNKKVFAVPGPITSKMSKGTLKLLRQGATLVQGWEDIIKELNIKPKTKNLKHKINSLKLNKEEKLVYKTLENEPLEIDKIVRIAKIPAGKLMVILTDLELRGIVKNSEGKFGITQLRETA